MSNHTKKWIKAAGIRAIRTAAQTAIGALGATVLIHEVDFTLVLSATAFTVLLSLLTSIAGLPEVEEGE